MIDFFNLPNNSNSSTFYAKGADLQVWNKPENCSLVSIFCLGSGAGGGSGGQNNGTKSGGSGGSAAAYSVGYFAANQLPNVLYLYVANGGAGSPGGTSTAAGSSGELSYISIQPNNTSINILLQSGTAVAGGGATASSALGAAGTVWTSSVLSPLGIIEVNAGTQGGPGTVGSGVSTNLTITALITGGAGGAGSTNIAVNTGGNITGLNYLPTISGGAGVVSGVANEGGKGIKYNDLLVFLGGAGGGSSGTSTGGNGGNGSFGCGGGGGGGGFTSLAGAGGKGGDGLIIITCS